VSKPDFQSGISESALRLCLRSRWDPAAAAELNVQAQQPGWSWEAVVARAFAEDLAPLLCVQLSPTGWWAALPPGIRDALIAAYEGSAIRSAVLFTELEEIIGRMAQAGVSVLLLKGAALAEALYGDPACRPMRDLDLLVQPAQVAAALAVLTECGYAEADCAARPGATLAWENELLLRKPGIVGVQVELHWGLFDSPFYQQYMPVAWLWETAAPICVGRVTSATLGPEALLLYLCAHLALHHRGDGLKWWLDLAEVIRSQAGWFDWSGLLRQAEACALVIPLQEALPALVKRWGVRVPPDFLLRLATARPAFAERRAHARLTAARRPVAQRFWADLAELPAWPARVRFAWAHIAPTPDYMVSRYRPPCRWLIPFLYPWRWLTGLAGALAYVATAARPCADR